MSGVGEHSDWLALKKLLTSWHVGVLYNLFKEEDIAINELKMMQPSHIHSLLKDYKMGIRIRFEYNLNNWRHKIGIPLKPVQSNHHDMCCSNYKANFETNITENQNIKNKNTALNVENEKRVYQNIETTKQTNLNVNQAPLSPQSVNSNTSLANMLTSNELVNFMPIPAIGSPNDKINNTDGEIENMPLQALGELLSDSAYEASPKLRPKCKSDTCKINLKHILDKSGSRGMSIVKFFREKNRLTNVHRSQLIQIIVDYFVENEHHLSLNLSHNLERELLKMFPTEKLEFYRTEKRGKIYAKFSNMKRYKRERNNKAQTEMIMMALKSPRRTRKKDYEANNVAQEDNMETNNDESWNEPPEPDIVVKEEGLSGNEE